MNPERRARRLLLHSILCAGCLVGSTQAAQAGPAEPGDCDGDGTGDAEEIATGEAEDCDGNGLPDGCELATRFGLTRLAPLDVATGDEVGTPVSVAASDLDGDGRLDLITASDSEPAVLVHFGRDGAEDGSPAFDDPLRIETPSPPHSILASDLNGDGRPELVTANPGSDSVSVFTNAAARSFEGPVNLASDTRPVDVRAADFDGDGLRDLVVANEDAGTVELFLNDGDGGFTPSDEVEAGAALVSLAPVELDGDGNLDLVVVDRDAGALVALTGGGDGTFENRASIEVGIDPQAVVSADLDQDGDLDLAVSNEGSDDMVVTWNDGAGTLQLTVASVLSVPTGSRSVVAADLDVDGHQDLAVLRPFDPGSTERALVFLNRGDTDFAESSVEVPGAGAQLEAMVAGDFDEDGDPDLAVFGQWGGPEPTNRVEFFSNELFPPGYRDRDHDGVLDACQGVFHRGDADASGRSDISDAIFIVNFLFSGGPAPGCVDAADTNDDGRLDISDGIFLLGFLFLPGKAVPSPGVPGSGPCGPDPSDDELACEVYAACEAIGLP